MLLMTSLLLQIAELMGNLFAKWPEEEAELDYDDPDHPASAPADDEEGEDGAGPSAAAASCHENLPAIPRACTRRKLVLEDSDSDIEDCLSAQQKAQVGSARPGEHYASTSACFASCSARPSCSTLRFGRYKILSKCRRN